MQINTYIATTESKHNQLVDMSLTKEKECRDRGADIITTSSCNINPTFPESLTEYDSTTITMSQLADRVENRDTVGALITPKYTDAAKFTYDLEINVYRDPFGDFCRVIITIGNLAIMMNDSNERLIDVIKHSDVNLANDDNTDVLIRLAKALDTL